MAGGLRVPIDAAALKDLQKYLELLPDVAATSARIALNDVATGEGLTALKQDINEEVNYPAGYLNQKERLYVRRKALNSRLEVIIAGRDRPTSLARFMLNFVRGKGVNVQIKRGGRVTDFKRAFPIRLRAGATQTNDSFNLGLAIRVKPGERVKGKHLQAVKLFQDVYLLYGPSVAQVFGQVAEDDTPLVIDMVDTEFTRQFSRLAGKK